VDQKHRPQHKFNITIALLEGVRVGDRRMQREDIDTMAASGDIDGLVGALEDQDSEIRQKAAAHLGFMGDPRAVEPRARLRDSDPTATVLRAAGIAHQRLSECIAATEKECEQSLCPPDT